MDILLVSKRSVQEDVSMNHFKTFTDFLTMFLYHFYATWAELYAQLRHIYLLEMTINVSTCKVNLNASNSVYIYIYVYFFSFLFHTQSVLSLICQLALIDGFIYKSF